MSSYRIFDWWTWESNKIWSIYLTFLFLRKSFFIAICNLIFNLLILLLPFPNFFSPKDPESMKTVISSNEKRKKFSWDLPQFFLVPEDHMTLKNITKEMFQFFMQIIDHDCTTQKFLRNLGIKHFSKCWKILKKKLIYVWQVLILMFHCLAKISHINSFPC